MLIRKEKTLMESFTSKNCQKLNNLFSISPARKWTVTICLILKEFLSERVALEPWLEESLEQLFPCSRNTFYLLQKNGRDVIESAIPKIGGFLSGQTSIKKAVKKTAKSTIRKQVGGGMKKRKNTIQRIVRQKIWKDFWKNLD